MNQYLKCHLRELSLACIAGAKLGFISKELWFDHFMNGETARLKNKTWRMLLTYQLFRADLGVSCGHPRSGKIEFLELTTSGRALAKGLGYKPVARISDESRNDVSAWTTCCLELFRGGITGDFKLERELRTNNDAPFLLQQKSNYRGYPNAVVKVAGTESDAWIALKRQTIGGPIGEYRAFAEKIRTSRIKIFVFLQSPLSYRGEICERLLEAADWTNSEKQIAFADESHFLRDPHGTSLKFKNSEMTVAQMIREICSAENLRASPVEGRRPLDTLLKAWTKEFRKAA